MSRFAHGQRLLMAIRREYLPANLLPRCGFSFASEGVRLPFLVGILIFVSLAHAQTPPQQYVYLSSNGAVAGFSKASQTGALSLVPGSPFPERLEGGLMAIDGQGKFAFVLNPTSDDISMFQIDQATGALSEVLGSPFAAPPIFPTWSPPSSPLSITTERSGRFVFVGYKFANGTDIRSSVVSFAIDTSGSSPVLNPVGSILLNTGSPIRLLSDSKGLYLYAGLDISNSGAQASGAELLYIDGSGNLLDQGLTARSPINFGFDYAIDPQSRFIFEYGGLSSEYLVSCVISPVDGTASTCSSPLYLGFPDGGGRMLVESSGHFLYMPGPPTGPPQNTAVFSIDQGTGVATQVGFTPATFASNGSAVADPLGPYIYSSESSGIHVYLVDQQTGNLTDISGSPFSTGATGGIAISGTPLPPITDPAATISPSGPANFGSFTVGAISPSQLFSIVHLGNQALAINSISIVGTNASSFSQTNTCLATLAPSAHCSVSISFTPKSAGALMANLQVADNAPSSPQALALNGIGVAPAPAAAFSPSSLSFPATTQGTSSAPQTLVVTNSGTGPLHVASVSLGGPNPSDFSFTNNCTAAVAPGSNCTIPIVFSPIAPGQRTATLLLSDDASGSPQSYALSATANPAFMAGPAPGGSTSATVSAGQTAQFQLQLMPGQGFTGTVSLACSGAPLGATCQVPASVSIANGNAAPFTVTVITSGPAAVPPLAPLRLLPAPRVPQFTILVLALLLLIFVLVVRYRLVESGSNRNRLALSSVLVAFVCAIALINIAGCGGGSTSPPRVITPSGNSTITVTPSAMSSTGQPLQLQPIQLTLTVK